MFLFQKKQNSVLPYNILRTLGKVMWVQQEHLAMKRLFPSFLLTRWLNLEEDIVCQSNIFYPTNYFRRKWKKITEWDFVTKAISQYSHNPIFEPFISFVTTFIPTFLTTFLTTMSFYQALKFPVQWKCSVALMCSNFEASLYWWQA